MDSAKNGQDKETKTVDPLNVGMAMAFLLIILVAAFYANSITWVAQVPRCSRRLLGGQE